MDKSDKTRSASNEKEGPCADQSECVETLVKHLTSSRAESNCTTVKESRIIVVEK